MADDTKLSRHITNCDYKGIKRILAESNKLDMNFRDIVYDLQTPLMRVCHLNLQSDDLEEILDLMLNRTIDVNIQDGKGKTLLSHACFAQNNLMIETLGSCKQFYCNPNIEDDEGCTPLFHAIRSRNPTVVATLLDCFLGNGLDIDHLDSRGITALEEAESKCDREICHLLKSKGKATVTGVNLMSRDVRELKQKRSPTPKSSRAIKARIRKKHEHQLSPLIVTNREEPFTRMNKSCESLKSEYKSDYSDDVFQENHSRTKDTKVRRHPKLSPRERENSFSLPDLRDNSGSLVSSSPSSASLLSELSLKNMTTLQTDETLNDEHTDQFSQSIDSGTFRRKKRKNSLSLPELRLDLQKGQAGNGNNNGMSGSSSKNNSETTPISNRSSIYYSIDAMTSKSNGSLSSRQKALTNTSLTLPQIDTTPRVGYPRIDTDRSTTGNSTNRGLKGLKTYDALVS